MADSPERWRNVLLEAFREAPREEAVPFAAGELVRFFRDEGSGEFDLSVASVYSLCPMVMAALVVMQPDLGTAFELFVISLTMLFVAGLSMRYLMYAALAATLDLATSRALVEAMAVVAQEQGEQGRPDQGLRILRTLEAWAPGQHGGTLNMLIGRSRDVRMLVVYGYARLVGYDHVLSIEHEDSVMSGAEGLRKAIDFLKGIVIKEPAGEAYWA